MERIISNKKLQAFEDLYKSISLTTDYRFNSYRRLNSLEGISNVALISSSTALIVVSFIVALYSQNLGCNEIYFNIGQNCLPIIMLALSILVSGSKYGARAEKIHECAQSLNNLKKLLKFDINDEDFQHSNENYKKYAEQYSYIISKYENHSKIDLVIEGIRSIKSNSYLMILLELIASLLGRGLIYYFYLVVFLMSVIWMVLGVYLAIKGAVTC